MDLSFSPEQEAFRTQLRTWLDANRTWDAHAGPPRFDDLAEEVEWLRGWQRRLADGGWVGVAWPADHGGRGTGTAEHYIVQEELARAGSPELAGRIGVNLAGPTLLAHGTDEQKARWLPRILTAEDLWCQLFSEPEAGSDLASVRTRGERVEGGWRVTGQKVWTSYAQFADWGLCLVRSDPDAPKHHGITYLVIDMHAAGIEIRPLRQITDEVEFNEVFLEDVFVPDENRIGREHEGWAVTRSTLSHERGTSPRQLVKHLQLVEELLRLALETGRIEDPRIEQRVATAYADVRIFQLHNWRTLSRLEKGLDPGPEGSLLKLYWSERSQDLHETLMEVLGPAAPLWHGADANPGDGRLQRSWLYYQAATIFAGTSEIQRNIIGERLLGLPREPRRHDERRDDA
ncbi:MAG: acyl-CoA dehydrogenase family protein [Actinobacteria bacterium]|nr:acyl-CoA dehydrogenase family protein [Actinomycetota bacterium]